MKSRKLGIGGYTLAELLVVLAIISLITVLIPMGYRSFVPSARAEAKAREVVQFLREAHEASVFEQTIVRIELANGGHTLRIAGGGHAVGMSAGTTTSYQPSLALSSSDRASIVFYPDGGSSGGRLILRQGRQRRHITIHWLFGHVDLANR